MNALSIIGGGRWARTIASVLCTLPDAPSRVILHSRHNSAGIRDWIVQKGLDDRLAVSPDWPSDGASPPSAVIVANHVAEHSGAAVAAFKSRCPVLIEKPVAISGGAIRQVADAAAQAGVPLAASHVFLFARYIEAFSSLVRKAAPLQRLMFLWTDGQADVRHGEAKFYDARVSAFDDILPHILPIIARIVPEALHFDGLEVDRGGAKISILASAGEVQVQILLERNGKERRRMLSATTVAGTYELDFSQEPGTITRPDGRQLDSDPLWATGPRPLGAMLCAFLAGAAGAALDERLSIAGALRSAELADAVRVAYAQHQANWLLDCSAVSPEEFGAYALRELGLPKMTDGSIAPGRVLTLLEQQNG
jgi:predicted dehydrogenase